MVEPWLWRLKPRISIRPRSSHTVQIHQLAHNVNVNHKRHEHAGSDGLLVGEAVEDFGLTSLVYRKQISISNGGGTMVKCEIIGCVRNHSLRVVPVMSIIT